MFNLEFKLLNSNLKSKDRIMTGTQSKQYQKIYYLEFSYLFLNLFPFWH